MIILKLELDILFNKAESFLEADEEAIRISYLSFRYHFF